MHILVIITDSFDHPDKSLFQGAGISWQVIFISSCSSRSDSI